MKATRFALAALLLAGSLAACAPRTRETNQTLPATPSAPEAAAPEAPDPGDTITLTDPVALEADRAAQEAFHLMALSYLETGAYSANVLLERLELPTGVRWILEDVSETSYSLRLTADALPEVAWFVTPEGVRAQQVEDNRSL